MTTKFSDAIIILDPTREFCFEISDLEIYSFKNPREYKTYILGRLIIKKHELKVRPWHEVLATDTE